MPREFIPVFYSERRDERRGVVGLELSSDHVQVMVLFSGGDYSIYEAKRLANALGVPNNVQWLWDGVKTLPHATLRAIPGEHRNMSQRGKKR